MEDQRIASPRVISPSPIHSNVNALRIDPTNIIGARASRITPEIVNDIHQRLNIDTSDETSEEDYSSDETSFDDDDEDRPICNGLPIASLPTGLCYDERMRFHAEVQATIGENIHPEDPRRIYWIYKYLCEAGLVAEDNGRNLKPLANPPLFRIDAREATREECCRVHTQAHYDFVKTTQSKEPSSDPGGLLTGDTALPNDRLIELSDERNMDSIYFNNLSYFSSKLSAGAAIDTCRAVVQRRVKNAFAVIRPPGHHAEISKTMGFCLFNNVCIASRICQDDFGEECRKILILDWDVHHGNGCQESFYEDPNILYISIHVHMNGNFYPATEYGDMNHCGEGAGKGKNVNIPWEYKGMGDGDYMYAFQQIVMPIAFEFNPDLVIIAAGFDAAAGDELGGCFVSPACYAHMTHMLMSLAKGKVAVCLEGGYNFKSIAKSAVAVTKTLMGEPPDRLQSTTPSESGMTVVKQVKKIQAKYWKSLHPKDPIVGIYQGERLHDIIRQWQAMHLYDNHRFTQLHIFRDGISPSFNQQVLATQGWEDKKNLLVIFHDQPDLLGDSKSTVGEHEQHDLHNTWLVDGCKSYIHRAVNANFGVIDINIPDHLTDPNLNASADYSSTAPSPSDLQKKLSEDLAFYIWDNYISTSTAYDTDTIFFMGVGNAFQGIAKLISEKEGVYKAIAGVVGFIAKNPVRPISNVGDWYKKHSLVWVSSTHAYWSKYPMLGKSSKRFGRVNKSEQSVLNAMMLENEMEAWRWIEEKAAPEDSEDEESSMERGKPLPGFVRVGNSRGGPRDEDDVVMSMMER